MEIQTFYFVYQTTNLVNGKTYIGKHKTKNLDDGYIGSGKLLKQAIAKYGRENFSFEILEWFEDESSVNAREAELVTEEFCLRDDNYNLCVGGKGGFSYINREGLGDKVASGKAARIKSDATLEKRYGPDFRRWRTNLALKTKLEKYGNHFGPNFEEVRGFKGRTHSDETKQKMSIARKAHGVNSQQGSIWITNGTINKKVKAVDPIPDGWYKGRIMNKPG